MSQGASFSTVGKYGTVGADARAAERAAADAQEARRKKLPATGALSEEELLAELLAHFDTDSSGALGYEQFLEFFKALDPDAALTRSEFVELCESLEMPPAAGVNNLGVFFDDDLPAIRALHAKAVVAAAKASGPCPVCGCLPTGDAAGERMQVARGGCLCHELRAEFCGAAPARIKFGKHKDRTLLDVYFEEPDYMRWLVENAAPSKATSGMASETDRFIARVAKCEHYLQNYFFEKEPEPVMLPAGDPMDRLTRQRYGTQGMDRMTEYDEFVSTGLISDDRKKTSSSTSKSQQAKNVTPEPEPQQPDTSYYELLFGRVARASGSSSSSSGGAAGGKGSISIEKFKESGAELGLTDEAAAALFATLDLNSDGQVSFDEFVAGYSTFAAAASGVQAEVARQIDFCALDLAIAAGFAQGQAVLICDPTGRTSQFLAYQTADTIDCKGLFVLDKIHGRPREEILEQARVSLTSALRSGRWLHLELGKSAPSFGEVDGVHHFPARSLCSTAFGRNKDAHAALVPPEQRGGRNEFWSMYFDQRTGGSVHLPGEWGSQGHGLILTTAFQPADYAEFLQNAWPEMPLDQMIQYTIAP